MELKKCLYYNLYYILYWYWDNGFARPLTVDDFPFQVHIENENGGLIPIVQKDVQDFHRTLGVRLNPLCQMDGELDFLQKKSTQYATLTSTSSFSQAETERAYNTT